MSEQIGGPFPIVEKKKFIDDKKTISGWLVGTTKVC